MGGAPTANTIMSNPQNTLKSPLQVAWESMDSTKAKLLKDTKQRILDIRAEVRLLEQEECQLENILNQTS